MVEFYLKAESPRTILTMKSINGMTKIPSTAGNGLIRYFLKAKLRLITLMRIISMVVT